jgi:hypothetical protein
MCGLYRTLVVNLVVIVQGHLSIIDKLRIAFESDRANFSGLHHSQEGRGDQGQKDVCDRLRSVRGGGPL